MQDETERTAQDTHPEGQAQGAPEGNTPPTTYTQAQLEEAVAKAVQAARIKAGRDAKSLETREAALNTREDELTRKEREQEALETEQYRGEPEGLKLIQDRRKLKLDREELARHRSEFEAERSGHKDRLARADEMELELNIWQAARDEGIDAEELQEECAVLDLKTGEQIREIAETLGRAKSATMSLRVDSSRGSGGGGRLTADRADKMSMEEYAAARKREDPSLF
jgi:hypothetical protein